MIALSSEVVAPRLCAGLPLADPAGLTARQLESAEEALEEVAQRLAHDLRTPLRHVISYAELLQAGPPDAGPVAGDPLQKVLAAARLLQRGLDELSALARVRQSLLQWCPVDMDGLVRLAWADLAEADASPARPRLVVLGRLPVVPGDEGLLLLVWQRLLRGLSRAVAGPGGRGEVQVSGHPGPGGCTFSLHGVPGDPGWAAAVPPAVVGRGDAAEQALVRRILGSLGGHFWPLPADAGPGFGFWLSGA